MFDSEAFSLDSFSSDSWFSDPTKPPHGGLHKGLHGLKAKFRKEETEEEKLLRREAQGIIERIKTAVPHQVDKLKQEALDVSVRLQDAAELISLSPFIDSEQRSEKIRQQIEELDMAYIFMMLAVHL